MTTSVQMTPADVLKLIKRARSRGRVHIGVHVEVSMPTTEGRGYGYPTLVSDLTLNQATKLLTDMQRFHDNKVARGDHGGMLNVNDTLSEFDGKTRFIHFG
jgi:hypothetical protein